jgi:hypothetical protein
MVQGMTGQYTSIIIYLINKDTKRFIPPSIASTVQECLTLTLKKVLEFYHKSFGKSLSTSEVSELFEIQIGEWCDTGACYISVGMKRLASLFIK